jgi:hypothetical protein
MIPHPLYEDVRLLIATVADCGQVNDVPRSGEHQPAVARKVRRQVRFTVTRDASKVD